MREEGRRVFPGARRKPRPIESIHAATAVSQLPSTGAEIAEWLFHQEKATLENAEKCTGIMKPPCNRSHKCLRAFSGKCETQQQGGSHKSCESTKLVYETGSSVASLKFVEEQLQVLRLISAQNAPKFAQDDHLTVMRTSDSGHYSGFDSALFRNLDAKWHFPQENGTLLNLQMSTRESKPL